MRYQQLAANEGHIDPSFSTNIPRDLNQLNPNNVQYQVISDANDYNRADRARSRKVYRIKNPFQNQLEEVPQNESVDLQDSGTAASNQYASMQYSLPPEEFLQQMRENQYHQQQQQQQTTPAPNLGYTVTPVPQYQYSTIPSGSFDNTNQQSNPIPQLDPKSHQYLSNNGYQFNPQNTFPYDSVQSTPSPVTTYLSTALPNNQYAGSASSYVSSSSPIFLSSPSNVQYVSSPLSSIQTGTPDYNSNIITTTIGSNSLNFNSNDQNKKLQIDHYDNSANGIRYPVNVPQQYQNEYVSSTLSPASVSYSDPRDGWQNSFNPGVNALSKSLQEVSVSQYQNYPYQQEARSDSTLDSNSETHRIGAVASANNVYLNYAQPDYQAYNNGKSKIRDTELETGQPEYYSNGEYGWKLSDRKPQINNDYSSANTGNYQRYQPLQNTGQAMSQMTFHMDTSRPSNYDQVSKSATEGIEAQEFAKAAANAHEYMKQQQTYYGNNYSNNYNSQNQGTSYNQNPYYGTVDKQKNKYTEVSTAAPYSYNSQSDLITASPYYYNSRENSIENKPKQPFDHAKALKTIVPIDVSNVISNSDSQLKGIGLDSNRYAIQNYGKEIAQNQQQLQQQQYRPLSDSYYKDKNAFYALNIKTKPDEYQSDNLKQFDTNTPYYAKPQQTPEPIYNQGGFSTGSQRISYNTQHNFQDSNPSNVQSGLQRPQNPSDINSILKLNDVPYQFTQSLPPESFRFQNNDFDRGSFPSQLPMRINQDVASHQLDVSSNLLNKLLLNKQVGIPFSRPDYESQASNSLSTINGFKVANPFNVDLKLVAEILKGKNPENTNIMALRDQFSKQAPQKIDLAQLQYLLKNENVGNLAPINEGLSALSNPFIDVYNSGRFPYQGVKYSRSQEEEEETIVPIADASSNHPIGAVTDQDDPIHEREAGTGSDATGQGEENISIGFEEDRAKKSFTSAHRMVRDRHRHPNSLPPGRHSYQRKYPKSEVEEPYPLLKPPPPHSVRGRGSHIKPEKGRRRRVKPRVYNFFKTEALFEADNENENVENSVPTVLRPPPPVVESKSDNVENIEVSS